MRTFVIIPKNMLEKINATTKTIAMNRYLKTHPAVKLEELVIVDESKITYGAIRVSDVTEVKEQGVVITETPKPANPPIYDPEA